jgi:hypothetical protein
MLFLLGFVIIKIFRSNPFFISKWQPFKNFNSKYL